MKLLVIDDDKAHAEATAEIVRRLGHDVDVAFSGEAGIARLRLADLDAALAFRNLAYRQHGCSFRPDSGRFRGGRRRPDLRSGRR